MDIKYIKQEPECIRFGDLDLAKIFMSMDGKIYYRCGDISNYNCINLETAEHKFFEDNTFVRRVRTKLMVEV